MARCLVPETTVQADLTAAVSGTTGITVNTGENVDSSPSSGNHAHMKYCLCFVRGLSLLSLWTLMTKVTETNPAEGGACLAESLGQSAEISRGFCLKDMSKGPT